MLDWSFKHYECLPLLVVLLTDKEVSKNEDDLDMLYDCDKEKLSKNLWADPENKELLSSILSALISDSFITETAYPKTKLSRENFSNIFLEPACFFRWAEKLDYEHYL